MVTARYVISHLTFHELYFKNKKETCLWNDTTVPPGHSELICHTTSIFISQFAATLSCGPHPTIMNDLMVLTHAKIQPCQDEIQIQFQILYCIHSHLLESCPHCWPLWEANNVERIGKAGNWYSYDKHKITQKSNWLLKFNAYRQTSNISRTLVGNNKTVDHSDVVGAVPVGTAPTTSSFSTHHLTSIDCTKTTARRDENHLSFVIWCVLH